VRLKESLADPVTLRVQAGSFDSLRTFVAVSPRSAKADSFLAYEGSRTDGPFLAPLHHRRDSLTGSYARRRSDTESFGLRLNVGRNDFSSSGQVPLDEVEAGRLDRFGFLDPDNGGRVRAGTLGGHYRRQLRSGDLLKLDAFVSRSLFDLYSDFTFFLNDERSGDEVQQHDSRLQGGANAQWLRPHRLFGHPAVLVSGANVHDNHIRVGLSPTVARRPVGVATLAHAHVANAAGYLQEGADLLDGRLHVEAGLRFDAFRFAIEDQVDAEGSGVSTAAALQPKATLAFTPSPRLPLTLHLRYGRGISSQDARGVVRSPSGPKLSTTDFYQVGLSSSGRRVSAAAALFLIDRSHEQVYIPDDGSIEFAGPSRSSGFEVKATAHLTGALSVNGGLTQVISAFYRGTVPRAYVEAAPHTVASAGLTLTGWKGLSGSLRYRHVSDYRLDALDPSVIAGGLDVVDLSLRRSLGRRASLSLSLDNLTDARYYETQNYFESRLRPEEPALARIHGTPGYPRTLTAGIMVQLPLH